MSRHLRRAAMLAAALFTAWCYIPPLGSVVELRDLEPFLELDVAHGTPVFIRTKEHVYYRVRLNAIVPPWFSWNHFEHLRRRGVQFRRITTSPFAPGFRAQGWKAAVAKEATTKPYAITYWKSTDFAATSSPVFMRWPWLYVRLGTDVLKPPLTAIVVPDSDQASLAIEIPRFPGAVLAAAVVSDWTILLDFCAQATPREVLAFYRTALGVTAATTAQEQDKEWFRIPEPLATDLLQPKDLQVEVQNMLFSDDPLVIWPAHILASVPTDFPTRQPSQLTHLPAVVRYRVTLRYGAGDNARAAEAFERIVRTNKLRTT